MATSTPYKGVPFSIPSKIEAEDFDNGGEGIAYHNPYPRGLSSYYRTKETITLEQCNEGGFLIGYISDGEWLNYSINVVEAGKYDFVFRVASGGNPTKKMHMEIDGVNVTGPLSYSDVSGWYSWKDLKVAGINLATGSHLMKVVFDTWGFNINYIDIKKLSVVEDVVITEFLINKNPDGNYTFTLNIDSVKYQVQIRKVI